ncbi:MAG TPA: tripartite tricarboxylate transporter substrate binding protein [Xanthobacteraceae bacterium]|jgi:tripartite-type tricarboxylate transporter receptor subunit TctC|nr:tripartite tricarboxylate transporter substrate binding protein [Xanthobacteraceae bacterium]
MRRTKARTVWKIAPAILPLLVTSVCGAVDPASAETYPARMIRIVVPFTPGGPVDLVARLVAQRMAPALGQSVIIENRPGGAGVIGAKAVANAEPDGYTLLFGNISTLAVIPAVTHNRDYDPAKNFVPVAKVSDSPELLVIDPTLPARSVRELVAYAKARPAAVSYGSAGYGNATHLSAEWFKSKAGIDLVHVPYKGLSEALTGLMGGQVAMVFGAVEGVLPLVQQGKVRPLAVTAATRFPLVPDLPTMIESGIEGFTVTSFEGVVAPAGTPAAIVTQLNAVINDCLASAELRARFAQFGIAPSTGTPQEFAAFFAAENRRWAAIVADAHIGIE